MSGARAWRLRAGGHYLRTSGALQRVRIDADQERRDALSLVSGRPIARRPDRVGLPMTMLRQCDEKVHHDGSRAAFKPPVDLSQSAEDCTAHRGLDAKIWNRDIEHRIVCYRRLEEDRRWQESPGKYDRLRWQDKRGHIVLRSICCF